MDSFPKAMAKIRQLWNSVVDILHRRLGRKVPTPEVAPQTKLSQPGGLKATEGTRVSSPTGKLGPPSHVLAEHGPDVPMSQLRQRVIDGKSQNVTKFTDRARMETAIAETLDAKSADIDAWLKTNPPAGANMLFDHSPGLGNLGTGFRRTPTGTVKAISHDLTHVTVILKSDGKGGYVIQTAFPH